MLLYSVMRYILTVDSVSCLVLLRSKLVTVYSTTKCDNLFLSSLYIYICAYIFTHIDILYISDLVFSNILF